MSSLKSIFTFVLITVNFLGFAQDASHNFGNSQFHKDVINDYLGKVSFYSQYSSTVSSENDSGFYDLRINEKEDLFLEISLEVASGKVFMNINQKVAKTALELTSKAPKKMIILNSNEASALWHLEWTSRWGAISFFSGIS